MAIRSTGPEDMQAAYGMRCTNSCGECMHYQRGQCALHTPIAGRWRRNSCACGMFNRPADGVRVSDGGVFAPIALVDRGEEINPGEFIPVRNREHLTDYTVYAILKWEAMQA